MESGGGTECKGSATAGIDPGASPFSWHCHHGIVAGKIFCAIGRRLRHRRIRLCRIIAGSGPVESKPVIYILTRRVAITTDDGIISLDAGKRVKLIKDNGSTVLVSDGENNLEIDKSNLVDAATAASTTTTRGPAGGAVVKHDPNDFDTNYPYGEALEASVTGGFDKAAEYCEEAYRVNPTVPGIIQLRNMIYVMRSRELQLKQAKAMAASGAVCGWQAVGSDSPAAGNAMPHLMRYNSLPGPNGFACWPSFRICG